MIYGKEFKSMYMVYLWGINPEDSALIGPYVDEAEAMAAVASEFGETRTDSVEHAAIMVVPFKPVR